MNIGVYASYRIMFFSGSMPRSGIKTQCFLTPSCSSTGIWPSDKHTSLPFALGTPAIPTPTNFQQHQLWAARRRWDVSSKPIRSCPFPSVHSNIPPLPRAPLSTSEQWGRAAGAVAQEVLCCEMGCSLLQLIVRGFSGSSLLLFGKELGLGALLLPGGKFILSLNLRPSSWPL